ncbi:predicted protein [Botrytis cinerea T4]|uniref:Uncharacterized protein n=1 Tax=Botryotinia fuckeliana (strain T4) TaxID=999810 RepID=G2YA71_BOTF4|nr:predicted protein [Botrytis cinerea T4]
MIDTFIKREYSNSQPRSKAESDDHLTYAGNVYGEELIMRCSINA